ncbi:MAG: TetR/AcrR family transcriptional regulator [Candidatus Aminicenantes bacterium]|nr:MAG: TetR/AcrR family transcriptional regulator [Candidatus Aminicenantes bacterium]
MMTPKLPKEYSDFRKKQILMAAYECFIEKGYSDTTVREIAKRMSASTGVIYNYFKKKEEILEGIQEWSMENNRQVFKQMGQKDKAREAIEEFFKNNFECGTINELKKSARGNFSLWHEALKRENIREMFDSLYGFIVKNVSGFVKEGIEKKEISADLDPKTMAGFIMALVIGVQLQIALIDRLDTSAHIQGIKKILFSNVWRGLK